MKIGDIVKVIRAERKDGLVDVGKLCRLVDIQEDGDWDFFWYHVEPLDGELMYVTYFYKTSLKVVPEGELTEALYS